MDTDKKYIGIPWKDGGRVAPGGDFSAGLDCVGLAVAWLQENYGIVLPMVPDKNAEGQATELLAGRTFDETKLERGDVVFFAKAARGDARPTVCHVGIWLGNGKLLQALRGLPSRVDDGLTLTRRLHLQPVAALKPGEVGALTLALADSKLGDAVTWILLAVSLVLSLVSALLMPKLARFGNKYGRYGFDALLTQTSTEIPLPDLLGQVVVAGNSPYTQLSDKNLSSTASQQRANKIVILAAGPVYLVDDADFGITINGLTYSDKYFKNGTDYFGFFVNPDQTKAEAHTGTIGSDTYVPSMTIYDGGHAISVPVDVRANYDRTFPVYGYAGCAYVVFRLIDSSKFQSFNVTARVKGRLCRELNTSGFITGSTSAVPIGTGDGSTRRFKLLWEDVIAVTNLTVNGVSFTEISASNQTGNVFYLNRTKGYVEFPDTIPGSTHAIVGDVEYYGRTWTDNPARHIAYLLNEIGRGNGFDESKINFDSFGAAQTYYEDTVTWPNANGTVSGARYTTNYAVDFRKPIQEHLRALLDACHSVLFVSEGKFCLKPVQDAASVFSFDESNIIRDSFQAELVDRAEKANRIKAFYHSAETFNAETEAVREDISDQLAREARTGNGGVVEENLKFPAVDSQGQAERLAELFLRGEVQSRWQCSFKTTIQGLALEPQDVVSVTHSGHPTWAAKLFRVEDARLDQEGRIELQLSEYFAGGEI